MSFFNGRFELDKQRGKFGGVCAGLSNWMGISVSWIRAGLVISHGVFPYFIGLIWLVYLLAVIFSPVKPPEVRVLTFDYFGNPVVPLVASLADTWAKYRALEKRLAQIETYHTGHNSSLARQIDALSENDHEDASAMQAMIDAARRQAREAGAGSGFGRAAR